ncbi:MAG: hypothetical protein ACTSRX_06885 [Promethearchaeota archaeon]
MNKSYLRDNWVNILIKDEKNNQKIIIVDACHLWVGNIPIYFAFDTRQNFAGFRLPNRIHQQNKILFL